MSWPTTPTIGDEYTLDGKTWVYMGNETWQRKDISLLGSVETSHSVLGDGTTGDAVRLDGDETSPGNSKYYGTDGLGNKGYHGLPEEQFTSVETANSVTGDGSVGTPVALVNDENAPGNNKYYGTNNAGAKGYHGLPDGMDYPAAGIALSTGTGWGDSITDNSSRWDTAFLWGDHSQAGYLTSETDPTVPQHVKDILQTDIDNWNTAYGWGDHSAQGYLTTETDPTVPQHVKDIEAGDISNWDTAYGLRHDRKHVMSSASDHEMITERIIGRVASGTGAPQTLTDTQVRTFLNIADGANNYSHPNHSGDVTSEGDGATTITNKAVTYAKIQDASASTLIGNPTGSVGAVQEISLGGGLKFDGGAIETDLDLMWEEETYVLGANSRDAIKGVHNVIVLGNISQTLQEIIAGNELSGLAMRAPFSSNGQIATVIENSGGDTLFQVDMGGDVYMPGLRDNIGLKTNNILAIRSSGMVYEVDPSELGGAATTLSALTDTDIDNLQDGHGLYYNLSTGNWENSAPPEGEGGGTVTEVGLSAPTGFSVSGSPVTTLGTLTLSYASGYGLPTLTKQGQWDDAYAARHVRKHTISETDDHESANTWRVFYADAGKNIIELALGADGTFLKSNGTSSAPSWDTPAGENGVTSFTGLTDTPGNYTGAAGKFVAVNSGQTALEFVDAPSGNGTNYYVSGIDFTTNTRSLKLTREGLSDLTEVIDLATLSTGNGISGSSYNGSANRTWSIDFGTGATQVTPGNHTHGNITRDGKIGSTSNKVIVTGSGGVLDTTDTLEVSGSQVSVMDANINLRSEQRIILGFTGSPVIGSWCIFVPSNRSVFQIQRMNGYYIWETVLEIEGSSGIVEASDFKLKE